MHHDGPIIRDGGGEAFLSNRIRSALSEPLLEPTPGTSAKRLSVHLDFRPREDASYFPDGTRRQIDYVLAYDGYNGGQYSGDPCQEKSKEDWRVKIRRRYQARLRSEGLELYFEESQCNEIKTHFVLIHAPSHILIGRAEKMGLVKSILTSDNECEREVVEGLIDRILKRFKFFTFPEKVRDRIEERNYFKASVNHERLDCFIGSEDLENFFDGSERSMMVYDILMRASFGKENNDRHHMGIERLINNGTYTAAYSLHQKLEKTKCTGNSCSDREMLRKYWAKMSMFYKYQPLSLIKRYFGAKTGIYFSFFGFYIKIMSLASIVGLICFLYGLFTVAGDVPSQDVCEENGAVSNIIMCPVCDGYCDYMLLQSNCFYSRWAYLFDNPSTVIFSALMGIGVTIFLKGYKRFYAERAWQWGLLDFEVDEETVLPDYQAHVQEMQEKEELPVDKKKEPFIPFKKRVPRLFQSSGAVLLALCLVLAFLAGIVLARMIAVHFLYSTVSFKKSARILASFGAATLNVICILIFNYLYARLARKLTEREYPRTEEAFEKSYTFKVYLFQVVNRYSSLFYIAFVKGNMSSVPANNASALKPEKCEYGGCMLELSIQMAVIMIGVQTVKLVLKMCNPQLSKAYQSWRCRMSALKHRLSHCLGRNEHSSIPRFEIDYDLAEPSRYSFTDNYIEIMLQFGIVMLFAPAFKLAPLFALLFDVVILRLEAYNYLCVYRRTRPERSKDIEIWLYIIGAISNVSIVVNALLLAFTSEFIPKMVHFFYYSENGLHGYVNSSLSVYDASSLNVTGSAFFDYNISLCRFRGYRNPDDYGLTKKWWIILSVRLAFAFGYVMIIALIKAIINFCVPDIPSKIKEHLQKQKTLAVQARFRIMRSAKNSCSEMPNNSKSTMNRHSFHSLGSGGKSQATSDNRDSYGSLGGRSLNPVIVNRIVEEDGLEMHVIS